jgi:hypothetical protein
MSHALWSERPVNAPPKTRRSNAAGPAGARALGLLVSLALCAPAALAQVSHYVGTPIPPELVPPILPWDGIGDMDWATLDNGGRSHNDGAGLTLDGTVGQADAGALSSGTTELTGGYWANAVDTAPCYANCDQSTAPPVLNVGDFSCFLQKYAAGDAYANCDQSTASPVLNVADFTCFLLKYASGCP